MNIQEGRYVFYFNIPVATFKLKPYREVVFIKCPQAFKKDVLNCVDEYAQATEAVSILANLSLTPMQITH